MSWTTLLVVALALGAPAQVGKAGYDPSRDPAKDLEAVVKETGKSGKRILLVVGGEWCGWCHTLDKYLKAESEIQALWSGGFETLKVNYSTENKNEAFLKNYPRIPGYPHIYVLDKDGTFLHSQGTAALETGPSYSKDAMKSFLLKWTNKE